MAARVRGHYRIDLQGRFESLNDVNASAVPFTLPLSVMQKRNGRRSNLVPVSIAGVLLFGMGVSLVAALPQIQRMVISAEATHIASARASYIRTHPALQAMLAKRH